MDSIRSRVQVLVVNSGSSSIKFELFCMEPEQTLLSGEVERVGQADAALCVETPGPAARRTCEAVHARSHAEAMDHVLHALWSAPDPVNLQDIVAVGHRVVHGGTRFFEPTRIDRSVLEGIRDLQLLAPVHAKANVAGIEAAQATFPDVCHVAIFDTAFHHTIPPVACEYALPRQMARDHGIRRYGFHGTSHAYVARRAAAVLGRPLAELNLITLHLGNGASAAALRGGASVDTSMGMTPLEGLVMGTRCGDVDPAIPGLLGAVTELPREAVNHLLNFESGLKGLCGESDMRSVRGLIESGDADAALALDIYCYRAKKYVGAYYAALGRVDAIVFTAGVGEHDADVRRRVCSGLERLGIALDPARNSESPGSDGCERVISPDGAEVAVLVVPTDEEWEIARAAMACVQSDEARKGETDGS
jgi:acetate kinase